MANWAEWTQEFQKQQAAPILQDSLTSELHKISKLYNDSNVVYYASGFLQKPAIEGTSIEREDINGFMNALHGLEYNNNLVLIVHTPGGDVNAVQSIVEYLHQKFEHIVAIVPYLAMSGGSMISLASDEIILGKQSQIGPTDPQVFASNQRHSAKAIQDAFDRAKEDIEKNITLAHLWAPILQSMGPSLIIDAEKALEYSKSLVSTWLQKRMFREDNDSQKKSKEVADHVNADSESVYVHGQRIGIDELQQLGVRVTPLEDNQNLQEAVLSSYHLMTIIFEQTPSVKFIVNQKGMMWTKNVPQTVLQQPIALPQN